MKTINKNFFLSAFCFVLSLLAGCGGGGGGGGFTGPAAVFNLSAAQDNLYKGSSFKLSGSDTLGNKYSASLAFSDLGSKQVNGVNATYILLNVSLKNTDTNAEVSGTQELYFTNGYAPVLQVENPGNVQYIPTAVSVLPTTAIIGNSGPVATYSKSNGETEIDTWSLDSAPNGRAKLTFRTIRRDATNALVDDETNAITIDTLGKVYSLTARVTDASGEALTLSGDKQ